MQGDVTRDAGRRGRQRARDAPGATEIDRPLEAAHAGRHGTRDRLLMLMLLRHGLRVPEAVAPRRADVDLAQSRLRLRRLENGLSSGTRSTAAACADQALAHEPRGSPGTPPGTCSY